MKDLKSSIGDIKDDFDILDIEDVPASEIQYDQYNRMLYHPKFHSKNGTYWTFEDIKYLIQWYEVIGPEEMSFALERTLVTILHKVNELRKNGMMPRPSRKTWNERIKKELPK